MGFYQYLMNVTTASMLGVVADIINSSYKDRIKGLDRYIKFGITLCVASCMIIPLTNMLGEGSFSDKKFMHENVTAYDYNDEGLYILERECEERLGDEIYEKVGITPLYIGIKLRWENGIMEIAHAQITVGDITDKERESLEKTVKDALGTDLFEIIIG